jgi:lysophospholipase L1-like esterase
MYKNQISKIILAVVSLIMFLTVGELACRLFRFDYRKEIEGQFLKCNVPSHVKDVWKVNLFSNIFFPDKIWELYSPHRDFFWTLRSNSEHTDYKRHIQYKINSRGLRGEIVPYQKKKGEIRLLFLGDSCAFGWGVSYENTYSNVVKSLLQERFPGVDFEIINAAVPGYSSYQGLKYYKKELYKYNPDFVIIFFGANDCSVDMQSDKYRYVLPAWLLNIDGFLTKNSRFFQLLKINLGKRVLKKGLQQRVSYEDFVKNLSMFKEMADREGRVLYFIAPVWRDGNTLLRNQNLDFNPSINIFDAFQNKIKSGNYTARDLIFDKIHPSALGHHIIAEVLLERIVKENISDKL